MEPRNNRFYCGGKQICSVPRAPRTTLICFFDSSTHVNVHGDAPSQMQGEVVCLLFRNRGRIFRYVHAKVPSLRNCQ